MGSPKRGSCLNPICTGLLTLIIPRHAIFRELPQSADPKPVGCHWILWEHAAFPLSQTCLAVLGPLQSHWQRFPGSISAASHRTATVLERRRKPRHPIKQVLCPTFTVRVTNQKWWGDVPRAELLEKEVRHRDSPCQPMSLLPSQPPQPLSHHFKCVMEGEPNEGNPCLFSDPLSYLQSNTIPQVTAWFRKWWSDICRQLSTESSKCSQ